jgi:PPM family protein phosphatase
MSPQIEFGHGSHTGLRRDHNEDTYSADADMGLWLVADGMGGHEHGEVASALAREYVVKEFGAGRGLTQAIVTADQEIMRHSVERKSERPMGTTMVALSIKGADFEVAWVGDSRVYVFENNQLKQLSRDHSYVQDLVDTGVITAEQAKTNPHRNVVTQALGVTAPDQLRVENVSGSLRPGMHFLLCSDGLTEEVEDALIEAIIAKDLSAQETVDHLIMAALDGGGSDNVTVLFLKCS